MIDPAMLGPILAEVVTEVTAPLLARLDAQDEVIKAQAERIKALEATPFPREAVIGRDGSLIFTLSNGETKDLGVVVGRDGVDAKGQDGADGLGFDDLVIEQHDARTAVLRFVRADKVKDFPLSLPGFLDRGVWKETETYVQGDGVTYAGSFWISGSDSSGRPDTGKGWRLAVKKGRDGKDGDHGRKGDPGEPGKNGRDLTQLGADGRKW